MYQHQIVRINYTTYDMRRDQDSVNARTHPDIMLFASAGDSEAHDHPFLYARVIGVFHTKVRYTGPGATKTTCEEQTMEFLWVRWFELDSTYAHGFQHRRLPRVKFIGTDSDLDMCGFVDPRDVVRGAYLIPAFDHGETDEYMGPSSLARRDNGDDFDYRFHYVCM